MNKDDAAMDGSTLDWNAYDEIIKKLERYEKEFFFVIRTCKDDMKAEFEASPKIQLEIEQFTDAQMRAIAEDISEVLIVGYWDALHEAVEKELIR